MKSNFPTDALGFEIHLGSYYGYSNRQNGIVTAVIGVAIAVNPESVVLRVLHRGGGFFNSPLVKQKIIKPTITCCSNTLFKLETIELNWRNQNEN
jgi:hypothetical protein